jgi:cholest-4-en-3-one 26-monooxygenase
MVLAEREEQITLDNLDITDTDLYVKRGYPWKEWDLLRREAPVFWYQRPGFEPFWAITKYDDIAWISRNPEIFSNVQRLRLADIDGVDMLEHSRQISAQRWGGSPADPPDIVFMDPPEHRAYRSIVSSKFTPRMMTMLETHFEDLSDRYVGTFAQECIDRFEEGESVDFVHGLARMLPVAAICEMSGVPVEDWDKIFHWTEILVGAGDPDFMMEGLTREQTSRKNADEWEEYNNWLIQKRIDAGATGDDLLSVLLRGKVDGEPLTHRELLSFYTLLLAAGNETTRNAMTGGVQALLEHPDQRELLCNNPEMVETAVEEILRWTSIVIQFARTALEDTEIRGQQIRKGQTVGMFYPSANRDEDIFERPYEFDITRDPNPHFAFGGYGEHFCLGANLARWELRVTFKHLIPLLPHLELAGKPELVSHSLHLGGIKRLPVRYRKSG